MTGELARLAAEVGAHEAGAEAHATALPELPEGECGFDRCWVAK